MIDLRDYPVTAAVPSSLEGEYLRRAEVRRQQLAETEVPQATLAYLYCLNRHDLTDDERTSVDEHQDRALRGRKENRKINTLEVQAQEETSRAIYRGTPGYVPEDVKADRIGNPKTWYNYQTYMHARDVEDLKLEGNFGEFPIKGSPDIRGLLESREIMQIADRVEESAGSYPSLADMGIVRDHEVICSDHIVRAATTAEHLGYDALHAEDIVRTVADHNAFVEELSTSVTSAEANVALDQGLSVLWNAGGSGKHFIIHLGEIND